MQVNTRRLYRSRDRQLAGVAGGMAEYLDIDPTIVRILWILAGLFSGGLLILGYIILAFVIPEAPFTGAAYQGWTAPSGTTAGQGWSAAAGPAGYQAGYQPGAAAPAWSPDWAAQSAAERQARERSRGRGPGAAVVVGTILVVLGVIALFDSMMPSWFGAVVFGPALVIAIGAGLLVASIRRRDVAVAADATLNDQAAHAAPATDAAQAPSAVYGTAPAPAEATAATGAGYDVDATSTVDLGLPADPGDPQPDSEPR
jgi:phage shock protein PspC (stress-responsive transcriptional regulator)